MPNRSTLTFAVLCAATAGGGARASYIDAQPLPDNVPDGGYGGLGYGKGFVRDVASLAIGETAILLHPPLPLVGVLIVMERERKRNDSLVNG